MSAADLSASFRPALPPLPESAVPGPSAWPAIHRADVASTPWNLTAYDALKRVRLREDDVPRTQFDSAHWREFSLRAWQNRWVLRDAPKQ